MGFKQTVLAAAAAAALAPAVASSAIADSTLIISYSRTGNTQFLADQAQKATGAKLVRITPKVPYAERYSDMTGIAREEVRTGARREIATAIPDLAPYSTVIISTPLWWGSLSVPMATLLRDHPMEGKRIVPIITSGSSDPQGAVELISRLCPKARIEPVFWVPGDEAGSASGRLRSHLKRLGL